jgi:DNA polymerase-3 subunit alpha
MFKSPLYRFGITGQMLQQIALGGTMIALPIYLQMVLEYNAMQAGLFDMGAESPHAHALVDEPAWDDKKRLQEEKGALGFYLSGHLFDAYRDEVRRFVRQKVGDLKEGRDKLVAGIIASLRTQMTQRGKMLIALLDDGSGQCEITIFNEQFEANKALFKEDELLIVQGQARNDAFTGGIRFTADTVMDLERARSRYAQAVRLTVNGNADAAVLRRVLEPHVSKDDPAAANVVEAPAPRGGGRDGGRRPQAPLPNGLAVQVHYSNARAQGEMRLGDAWRVKPSDTLLAELRATFGGSIVEITY